MRLCQISHNYIIVINIEVILIFLLQEALKALLQMRRTIKEKELEALLAGEHDSCSCYIEVVSYLKI